TVPSRSVRHRNRFARLLDRGTGAPTGGRQAKRTSERRLLSPSHEEEPIMQVVTVRIEKPGKINFVLGQTHFIKSVEDIHEALVSAVPGIKFGLAFCEASGKCLVRWSGTDDSMVELARKNAVAIAAGHSFILFLDEGFYPLNVLNTLKMVPEVCRIYCATANPTEV